MKHLVFSLLSYFLLGTLLAQESKLPVFITDSLNNYIQRGMHQWQIPGLSLAIIKDGRIVLQKGYGTTRIENNTPVDENTLFLIGSNTKAFTSTTLAILQEEGKFSLNDKVQKWMPEFKLRDTLASDEIIVADLLSHRIGFETFQGDFTYWTSDLSRADIISKMALIHAVYPFRTKWGYCNAAFLTAGELIPRITGHSWETTVRDKIIKPLNMSRTIMLTADYSNTQNIATPYTIVDQKLIEIPVPMIDNLGPAASIGSSASDMAKWVLLQLNNGKSEGKQIISAKAINAIRKPYSIMGMDPRDQQETHFYLYGLGLEIKDRHGKIVYSHTGGVDGFLSSVMFIPEEKLGIVVLTNTDQNQFFLNLTNEIRDAFLNLPYQGYSDKAFISFSRNQKEIAQKNDSLRNVVVRLKGKSDFIPDKYTGIYSNELYGNVEIKVVNGDLNIYFPHHRGMTAKLGYLGNNRFLCTYSNPTMGIVEIPFKSENNLITGFTLSVNDFVEFLPYEFHRIN